MHCLIEFSYIVVESFFVCKEKKSLSVVSKCFLTSIYQVYIVNTFKFIGKEERWLCFAGPDNWHASVLSF